MSYEGPINIYHPLLGSGGVGTGGGEGNSVVASRVKGGA